MSNAEGNNFSPENADYNNAGDIAVIPGHEEECGFEDFSQRIESFPVFTSWQHGDCPGDRDYKDNNLEIIKDPRGSYHPELRNF